MQTHSTPLNFRVGPALVGVHHNLPLRVQSQASLPEKDPPASTPLARARLVQCRHRVVPPLEETAFLRADYDRPTLAKPLPGLCTDGSRATSIDCSSDVPSDCQTSDEPVKITIIQ